MVKMLFDSFGKIIYWVAWIFIFCFLCSYSVGVAIGIGLFLLIPGPCVAIPAMVANHGKHVLTNKSPNEIKKATADIFRMKKTGSRWIPTETGLGQLNYEMTQTKSGCEPVVSVNIDPVEHGGTLVSIWMSEWTHGGLNAGKGTPFWVWGGYRAMGKISDIARAVAS